MTTDDTVRYSLRRQLDTLVGPDEAALLMTGVPPFPWTEVVTKRDLEAFGKELRGELLEKLGVLEGKIGLLEGKIGVLEGKIGMVDGKVGAQTWKLVAANVASSLTTAGLVLAVVRLA